MSRKKRVETSSSSDSSSDSDVEVKPKRTKKSKRLQKKFAWIWFVPFVLLWLAVFFGVVLRLANKLPTALTIATEHLNKDRFIAERAMDILEGYAPIGVKLAGTVENEITTVNFILNQIKAVKSVINTDLFKLDVDVQEASGTFIHWEMVNLYQGIQNVVVRLSPLNSDSDSYLLINTHFDSQPTSPGAGDAGAMVVVMLEVLRVIAINSDTITHPIVFLFNGAEENPLQGSHAFITQHKWAKNCKALINLDSAGSGNRDIMFQSGPNNPWLMQYYKKAAVHPFATTVAEELFQSGLLPSDTDFSIFKTYGSVPGFDIAHTQNGYIYHTEYDKIDVIPIENLQNTGDNVLPLARALSNAPELEDPSIYAAGSAIFYDLLGQYFVCYTLAQGVQINYAVSILALVAIFLSLSCISGSSKVSYGGVLGRFIVTVIVQLISVVLGIGLSIGAAILLDNLGVSMSWFTYKWMVIGLYFCPLIFGIGLPSAALVGAWKNDKLNLSFRVQLVLNSQALIVAFLTAAATYYGIKSTYVFMLATLIYTVSSLFNTITTLYRRGFAWFWVVLLLQIPAYSYFTYIGHVFFTALIPMMGRFGSATNPDLYISGLSALFGTLALGFIVPLISLFKRPKLSLTLSLAVAVAFIGIALSPYGFPFRPATNIERISVLHVERVFYEYDKSVSLNESGYYFYPQDRREFTALTSVFDTSKLIPMADQCSEYMFCGLPVYNHRFNRAKNLSQWLPSGPVNLPGKPILTFINKTIDKDFSTVRFDFELDGPPHMGIYIGPLPGSNITGWSFLDLMLETMAPPYFIYFAKAKDQSTLKFWVTFEKPLATLRNQTFELGIGGHYVYDDAELNPENTAFIGSFPSFAPPVEWPSSYHRYIY